MRSFANAITQNLFWPQKLSNFNAAVIYSNAIRNSILFSPYPPWAEFLQVVVLSFH